MLKISVLLSLVIVCTARYTGRSHHHQDVMNVTELIRSNGYPVKTYTVQTSDGYLLDLIRIPHGLRGYQNQQQQQGYNYQNQKQQQGYNYQSQEHQQGYNYQSQEHQQQGHNYHSQEQYQQQQNGYGNKNAQNQQSSESDESNESSSSSNSDSSSSEHKGVSRPIVLLMHGLLSSADDYVIGGPTQGLAYILADNGYDVYLGNARGSIYGRRHTVLNPDRDPAFWKFCWDQIGRLDLPAIIDKVLKTTDQRQLYYIGHMQGSTVFYVMASERPEYNEKIRSMVALGPLAFMGQSNNIMLRLVADKLQSQGWLMKNLGASEFKPSTELMSEGGEPDCSKMGKNEKICQNDFFLLNGYNSDHLNTTTMASLLNRVPAGASARQIIHYGKLVKTGRFEKMGDYQQGQQQQHEQHEQQHQQQQSQGDRDYDLSKVTVPMALIYTPHDSLSTMADVEMLRRKLPNVKQTVRVEELTNNLDLLFADRIRSIVYDKMMKMMRNIGGEQ